MKPVSRKELIRRFRALGFEGPFVGGRHSFMRKGALKLQEAGIREERWNKL